MATPDNGKQLNQKTAPMTMIQALRSAIDVMLEKDDNVVVFGQDVGYFGGVFRVTEGLQKKYGKSRVFDTPISEGGIVGVGIGMAAYGLRPCIGAPALPLGGRLYRAADDPHPMRGRHLRRPDPQPEPGGGICPRVRPAHRHAIESVRRQGPVDLGDGKR
jgi:hypothetical protein